jgi:iron complex outermembrane receptor protein
MTTRRVLWLACAFAPLPAWAGDGTGVAARSLPELEEVVVTARKVPEPLLTVPVAISVIDVPLLGTEPSVALDNISRAVPGLYYESLWGGIGSAPVLRGQSQPSTAGDNVGVFVDGVYQAERTAVDVAPIDVERVEVVHGPQSALFGHSTFAGAVHFLARQPTATPESGVTLGMGTDSFLQATGFASGPLLGDRLLGRIAAGRRERDGTYESLDGTSLGDQRRSDVAGSLAADLGAGWAANLSGRWTDHRESHAATNTVGADLYDCGAILPNTAYWSYYCGSLPARELFDISAGIPDSTGSVAQALLQFERRGDATDFVAATTYYEGWTDIYRDFDATSFGETYGVCVNGSNCPRPGTPPRPVTRFVRVNSVTSQRPRTTEWTQELRLSGRSDRVAWMLGAYGSYTTELGRIYQAFDRAGLRADERLTVVLPLTPQLTGPIARANQALVDDPNRSRRLQSSSETTRRTVAAFGTLDLRPTPEWTLRAELRASRERAELDSRVSSFVPSFGTSIEPSEYEFITPRFSVGYQPDPRSFVYASAARGARSGGVNPVPNLDPSEQSYDPEFNWTYELGARRAGERWQVALALYYIDWRDTQIIGFPTTPGVGSLITRNTAGIRTKGVELSLDAAPLPHVDVHASYSYTQPRFVSGSDDPGSSGFCGLSATNQESSFCNVGPARSGAVAGTTYVPYVDHNMPQRVPEQQAYLSVSGSDLPRFGGWSLRPAMDVSYQGDVYDRAINGASYGERTLVSGRVTFERKQWSVQLWGTNLTDELYVRAVSTRGPAFYPVSPRPLDLVYGEGRRVGVSVSYALGRR